MSITAIAEKCNAFSFVAEAEQIINAEPETVANFIRQQLLDGKNRDGSFLASMSTSSYFKKPGAWERYAKFKMDHFPSSVRPFDVPNLIFSEPGKYHPGIQVIAVNGYINYPNDSSIAGQVQETFNPEQTMGLTMESKEKYREILLPQLGKRLNEAVL